MQEKEEMMELLRKMVGDNEAQNLYLRKQLFFTRIFAVSCCLLTAALLVVMLRILPPLLTTTQKAVTAMDQAVATMQVMDETMEDVQSIFEEDGLVAHSSEALTQATEKISRMDIDSLNAAIADLGEVVEPLANFFEKFKR